MDKPYEKVKELMRGHTINKEQVEQFIDQQSFDPATAARLKALTPATYTAPPARWSTSTAEPSDNSHFHRRSISTGTVMNDQTITATSGDDDSKASPDARPMSDDVSGTTAHPVIEDVAPRRIHDFGDLVHAVSAVLLAAVAILSSIYLSGFVTGVESDAHSAGRALNWMVDLPTSMLQQLTIVTIAVMAIVQLLVGREWLQSALALLAMFGGLATVWGISMAVSTFGNFTLITALCSPSSIIGTGLLPDFSRVPRHC